MRLPPCSLFCYAYFELFFLFKKTELIQFIVIISYIKFIVKFFCYVSFELFIFYNMSLFSITHIHFNRFHIKLVSTRTITNHEGPHQLYSLFYSSSISTIPNHFGTRADFLTNFPFLHKANRLKFSVLS